MKIGNPLDKALGVGARTDAAQSATNAGKTSSTDEPVGQSAKVTLSAASSFLGANDGVVDASRRRSTTGLTKSTRKSSLTN